MQGEDHRAILRGMKGRMEPKNNYWVKELISFGLTMVGGLLVAYIAGSLLDPNREERKRKKANANLINRRLKRKLDLSPMEQLISDTVVNPDDIDISPEAIYGIDDLYRELLNKAVRPLQLQEVFSTTLLRQTRGLLLYGPPGTGKTMLGKALAKSCGCFFMNVSVSTIMSKWYGDAQKLVRAIFTLAEKLQPCIVFVDEVDSFLTTRGGHSEHEASLSIKTEFMQCWEGMSTRTSTRILVMGTTNRRSAIDPAVLRRFTSQYEIPLPNLDQRKGILKGYLRKHAEESGLGRATFSPEILSEDLRSYENGMLFIDWIAEKTDGFSGSDLHELCAQAAKAPVIEAFTHSYGSQIRPDSNVDLAYRPCGRQDFEAALSLVHPTSGDRLTDDQTSGNLNPHMMDWMNSQQRALETALLFLGTGQGSQSRAEDEAASNKNGANGSKPVERSNSKDPKI